jgi:hypothetical protein
MTPYDLGPAFDALFDEDIASLAGATVRTGHRQAAPGNTAGTITLVVAEIYLRHSGMNTRALLGGTFTLDAASAVTVVHLHAEDRDITVERTDPCPSRLGPALLRGLPSDLADAALSGLVGSGEPPLPGGVLVIDRAAHDQVDSSEFAFRLVGDFLVYMLAARFAGADIDQAIESYTETTLRRP